MTNIERDNLLFSFYHIINNSKMASFYDPSNDIRTDHIQEQETFRGAANRSPNGFQPTGTIIICSDMNNEERDLPQNYHSSKIKVCSDKSTFTEEHLPFPSFRNICLLVDRHIYAIITKNGRLHNSVHKYFRAASKKEKGIHVVNRCKTDTEKFNEVFYQLPKGRKEIKEVTITKQPVEQRIFQNQHSDEGSEEEEDDDEEDDEEDDDVDDDDDYEEEVVEEVEEEVEEEEEIGSTISSRHSDGRPGDGENLMEGILTDNGAASAKYSGQESTIHSKNRSARKTQNSQEIADLRVMCGTKNTMNVEACPSNTLMIRQDGNKNTVNLNIVPKETTSKLEICIRTDPSNPEVERQLKRHLEGNKEQININLQSSNAQLVSVREGSVIIEIQVLAGQEMTRAWTETVVRTVLAGSVGPVIPEGTTFNLDIEANQVVPAGTLTPQQQQQLRDLFEATEKKDASSTLKQTRHSPVSVEELTEILESVLKLGVTSGSHTIDTTDYDISFLETLSGLSHVDPWKIAIRYPKLFAEEGPIYKMVDEDVGISDGKHFQLPTFGEEKRFCYSEESQTIMLCLGKEHHIIGPDIETRIKPKGSSKKPRKVQKRSIKKRIKCTAAIQTDEEFTVSEDEEFDDLSELPTFSDSQSGKVKTKESTDSGFSDGTSDCKSKGGVVKASEHVLNQDKVDPSFTFLHFE